MAFQTGKNVKVRYKVEAVFGTAPATNASKVFRASPSEGLELTKANIQPTEYRADGMTVQGRHGSRSVGGGYDADLTVGTFDELFEAVMRGTWVAAFTVTEATMTSITTTTSTIVASAGSWITQGVKVGDVVRLTNHATAANNNKNLRVLGVTASTITVPTGDLVADAVADNAFTLTVAKRLVQGTTNRSFTFEEYFKDIDKSQVFTGCRITGMTLRFMPDSTVMVRFNVVGQNMTTYEAGNAPFYDEGTEVITTSLGLTVVDSKVRVNGADIVDFTSFEITFDLGGATVAVGGSQTSPDVFVNPAKITANISFLREDFDNLNAFVNETQFQIGILCVENDSEPKDFINFFLGNCKFGASQKGLGVDNGLIETLPVTVGIDTTGSGYSQTMLQVSTSAA